MKLAVIFPGIGYHTDKPLLYYAKKLAVNAGYTIKEVCYGGFPEGVKGSPEKMLSAFESALLQAKEILRDVPWQEYEEIVFISKSIGTAVAAAYGEAQKIETHNIFFTPVEASFRWMKDEGIVFSGTKDPWVSEGSIAKLCREKNYPLTEIAGGNHSLETGDILNDLSNMHKIMEIVKQYI